MLKGMKSELGEEKHSKEELYECLQSPDITLEMNDVNDIVIPTLLAHMIFMDLEEMDKENYEEYDLADMVHVISLMFNIFGDNEKGLELAWVMAKGNETALRVEEAVTGSLMFKYPFYKEYVMDKESYKKIRNSVIEVYTSNEDRINKHFGLNRKTLNRMSLGGN